MSEQTKQEPFSYVQESGRPRFTGRLTEHGHRVFFNPGTNAEAVEFPYGAEKLYSGSAYDEARKWALRDAAPALVEALEVVNCDCSVRERDSGHKVGCFMPQVAEALKLAKGEA